MGPLFDFLGFSLSGRAWEESGRAGPPRSQGWMWRLACGRYARPPTGGFAPAAFEDEGGTDLAGGFEAAVAGGHVGLEAEAPEGKGGKVAAEVRPGRGGRAPPLSADRPLCDPRATHARTLPPAALAYVSYG